ncbi:MAG: DUF5655 domain-containing protein [Promethearchaeota archaeon]
MIFWKCPKCKREFSKRNQWHSCVSISINEHFEGKAPLQKKIYNVLQKEIEKFGQIRIDAVQTSINIGGKYHFLSLFVLKESLKIDFILERRIQNPRFTRIRGPTNGYFTYTLKLNDLTDVNNELINWLRESYNIRNK